MAAVTARRLKRVYANGLKALKQQRALFEDILEKQRLTSRQLTTLGRIRQAKLRPSGQRRLCKACGLRKAGARYSFICKACRVR